MNNGYYEEDDKCPDCHIGSLKYIREDSCSCHINPPCSACVDAPLTCKNCGHKPNEDMPNEKDVPIVYGNPGISMRVYKPKPLDPTKIDWRSYSHTGFSMIKEGVYPEGTTEEEVLNEVKGTFGGRFTSFGNGKFRYIAYTD